MNMQQHTQSIVTFKKLKAVTVAVSTNKNEDIFDHKEKYYSFPPHEEDDVKCVVVGFVADMEGATTAGIEGLEHVLYAGTFQSSHARTSWSGLQDTWPWSWKRFLKPC